MRLLFCILVMMPFLCQAQVTQPDLDQLKKEILLLNDKVDNIQINLGQSHKKFKRGIAVATLGYTMTIAGGLMLGRKNDELGKGLLVAGGATGITGTILMVDAFKYLGRIGRNNRSKSDQLSDKKSNSF